MPNGNKKAIPTLETRAFIVIYMQKQKTLQTTIAIALFIIGMLGIALVISTDITYRKLAFEQQNESIEKLLAYKSSDLLQTLINRQKELGFRMQGDDNFLAAFNSNNNEKVRYWLDQEFNRYFVTIGLIKLEKLIVYDTKFNLVNVSDRGLTLQSKQNTPCKNLVLLSKKLSSIERLKPHSTLCQYENRPFLSTIVSIGNIHSKGFLQIITDPAHILTEISSELGMPLRLANTKGELIHQSANWPNKDLIDIQYILSHYSIKDSNNAPILNITVASDITHFNEKISATRSQVILAACCITLLTLFIALLILHRGLDPLKKLRKAANSLANGHFIAVEENSHYSEISAPIAAFNTMVKTIQALVKDLTTEVEEHTVTENKFRRAKEEAEQIAKQAEQHRKFLDLTLQSIVDGVITTTTDGYIKSMNPMAEQLTGWTQTQALNKPVVQVMHMLSSITNKRIYDPTENIEHKTVLDAPLAANLVQHNSNIETPIEYITAPMRDSNNNIVGIIFIIHDESMQSSLNRQLTFQATHDALTGLINRYEFDRRLKNVIASHTDSTVHHTLCYIDLDQFKLINDTCGHTAGDDLLKEVTRLLQDNTNHTGLLARLGGDEFGLLLENHTIEQAETAALSLLNIIQNYQFNWQGNNFNISASIGITPLTSNTITCEELLSNADSACNFAKENGRNRVQVYTSEDDKFLTQQREMHWVSRINLAMEENRFQLYFQEIMPVSDNEQPFILHGEILLRMIDKEGNIVSPNNFLPAAERYNMIGIIDQWVVDNAITWLASRKDKVLLSVNLSGTSLSNRDFLNFVVSKIKQHNINPELLCFEITETAAINYMSTAIHFMTVLKKLGCTFALDDFGSGLSSFAYLTSLPVDYLKIDGAFVMDIDKDPMHYAMVKSINEVGQVMGIRTIAEFVVSETIIEKLKTVGVDYAQGYAVARPVPLLSLKARDNMPPLSVVNSDTPSTLGPS